jgi:hypothetical protein
MHVSSQVSASTELHGTTSSKTVLYIYRWAGHVARIGEKRNAYRLLVGKPEVDGWIILGWILERWEGVIWTGLIWLRIGTGGELL